MNTMFWFRSFFVVAVAFLIAFGAPNGMSISFNGLTYSFSVFDLIFYVLMSALVFELVISVKHWWHVNFVMPRPIKCIRGLIENVVMRDEKKARKYVRKLENIFGSDNEVVIWINGYLNYYIGDQHAAKSCFYRLVEHGNDVLGGYSLFQMAKSSRDTKLAIESLESLYKRRSDIPNYLIDELGKLQLTRFNFNEAKRVFADSRNKRLLSIAYFLEDRQSISSLKQAYDACDSIPEIAVEYANKLVHYESDAKKAKKVLERTWDKVKVPEIFMAYARLCSNLNDLKPLLSESFVSYNEFGNFAMKEGMVGMAYEYLKKALSLYPSISTYRNICALCEQDRGLIPIEKIDVREDHFWRCKECNKSSTAWMPICDLCSSVDSYDFVPGPFLQNERKEYRYISG